MRPWQWVVLCWLAVLSHGALAQSAAAPGGFVSIPELRAPVTDTAGLLTPQQRTTLDNVLRELESRTGSQIAVLLVSSTAPEAIEQYGIRVAEAWQVGRKGIDDGVILIVAKDNPPALRRLRIEAGRGVQGSLTDAQSKRILQDVIAPHFRQNDFYGGISAGVSAIAALLAKEQLPAPERRAAPASQESSGIGLLPLLLFAVFFLLPMFSRRRRHALRHDSWGRSAGVVLGSAIGSQLGSRMGYGGGFGGYGGGGGGGFGGFSGGGGTFDGGGASGDW